VSISVAKCSEV